MTKNIKIQLGIIIGAFAAIAEELLGEQIPIQAVVRNPAGQERPPQQPPAPEPQPEAPRRTRRTKEQIAADNAAAEAAAKAAQSSGEGESGTGQPVTSLPGTNEKPKEEPVTGGKSYEELQAIIAPVVRGNKEKNIAGQGPAVKALIQKYVGSPDGVLTQLATMPQHHAAFIADVEALTY